MRVPVAVQRDRLFHLIGRAPRLLIVEAADEVNASLLDMLRANY